MSFEVSDPIRQWFIDHEDGDFIVASPSHAYSVLPALDGGAPVVYTTKRQCILAIIESAAIRPPFTLITRGGLPDEGDVGWLSSIIGQKHALFLGDAKPADLLIFTWLRSRVEIEFGGASDKSLEKFGVRLDPIMSIALSETESEALPVVRKQLPDYSALLGLECSLLLANGRKLELEALASFATVAPERILERLIQ
jgi:hypothetical protein